jgi:diguanylate cyclase (GGDEF)-like protein
VSVDGRELRLTVSAGIAAYPEDGRSVKELVAAADAALYRAKEAGRDRVEAPLRQQAKVGGT